jgi:hypothetical protein
MVVFIAMIMLIAIGVIVAVVFSTFFAALVQNLQHVPR